MDRALTRIMVALLLCLLASPLTVVHATGSGSGSLTAAGSVQRWAEGVDPTERSIEPPSRVETAQLRTFAGGGTVQNPGWLAYDSADTSFYVAVSPSSVDVVPFNSTGPLLVATTVPVGLSPFGVAVDNATGDVFVTNTGSDNVSVISGTTQTVVATVGVGSGPEGVAYDFATGDVYVANGGSGSVTVISGTTFAVVTSITVGLDPLGVAYDGATGRIFVADQGSAEVSVISGTSVRLLASVPVGLDPYGVAIDNVTDSVYVTNPGSSNLSVLSAVTEAVVATIPVAGFAGPTGPNNTLAGLVFDPTDGYVWVGAGFRYAIVIDPANESVLYFFPNDPSGVVFDPDSGDVCVTNSANRTFECWATLPGATTTRSIVFTETGLPRGTPWNVTLGAGIYGVAQDSTTSSILFGVGPPYVSGASIPYTVWPADGYAVTPSSGNASNEVPSPSTVDIAFSSAPGPFSVEFEEGGLPPGTSWSIDLAGTVRASTARTLNFSEPSGSYAYRLGNVPGWQEEFGTDSGVVAVNGAAVVVPILPFVPTNLGASPSAFPWTEVSGAIAVAAAGYVAVLWLYRTRPPKVR